MVKNHRCKFVLKSLTYIIKGVYLNLKFKISKFLKNDDNNIDKFILLSGLMLRLMYIYYTPIDVRQHDVHQFFQNQG